MTLRNFIIEDKYKVRVLEYALQYKITLFKNALWGIHCNLSILFL